MHQSKKYGYFLINGIKPDDKTIQLLLNLNSKSFKKCISELLLYGRIKKDENGVYYCKRMIEDNKLRIKRREAGSKGGNPLLVNQEDNQNNESKDKQKQTPSSSPSSSSSSSDENIEEKPLVPENKFSENDYRLAYLLKTLTMRNYPNQTEPKEHILKKWADCVRLLREVNKRVPKDIEKVLKWSQQDYFWKQNIRSGNSLRKQYDELTIKMEAKSPSDKNSKYDGEKINYGRQ
ncbi:MAG TPA: hypothetical protein ENH82_14740 [bacterium]|nr:hypothetical protein [bacterium]